jgi:hypothetical protein
VKTARDLKKKQFSSKWTVARRVTTLMVLLMHSATPAFKRWRLRTIASSLLD